MKNIKKMVALGVSAVMISSMLAGCGGGEVATGGEESNKLTYWIQMSGAAASRFKNLGETAFAKKLEEITGVDIDYIHPPAGQAGEKFSIMLSSNDMPDIVEYSWGAYPGGAAKALKDGVIINIADHKDKAPNLFKYFDENETVKKLSSDDDGKVFAFPFIRGEESLTVSSGIVIRYDWLEELGLELPETMDEWETVLTAFKEKKGAKTPLAADGRWSMFFENAYGLNEEFYQDDGVVKYGFAQPQYKDFLAKMASWYKKGLLGDSVSSLDGQTKDYNILNGVSGSTLESIGSGIGKYMRLATEPGFSLGPAPWPVLNKGDKPEYGLKENIVPGTFAAITSSCKNVDTAVKFLDAPYEVGGEAYMLYNFGVEGESYNMVDGYPTYTDDIKNNPEGMSMQEALSNYTMSYWAGPFVQDVRYMEQYGALPEQRKAMELWSATNQSAHQLPTLYPTEAELNEQARIQNDVSTYASEMKLKFIMGLEPLENYDKFVETLNERGLQRLIEIKQAALDRYNKK